MTPAARAPWPPRAAAAAATPGFARRAGAVLALGLFGVAGLWLQPLPPGLAVNPALAEAPAWAMKLLLALNPALWVLLAALLGAALAHRAGLRSLAAGTAPRHGSARTLGTWALIGVVFGLALAAFDALLRPWLGEDWQRLHAAAAADVPARLGAMLYGGLSEEVMLRWGLMGLVAWGLAALPGLQRRGWAPRAAIAVSAAVFAVAHLPVLAAQIDLSAAVVARTLLINAVAGLLYSWIFWRHHLEAAMAAHAATHLGLAAWHALAG